MSIEYLFNSFPQIETENLILRKMQASDSEALFNILSDHEVTEHYDDAAFTDVSQALDQIEAWEYGYSHKRSIRWGIVHKGDCSMIIGTCGYYAFHTWHLRASIGYELAKPYWRQGIMTETLKAVIGYGFRVLDLNRIQANIMPENVASIRLLKKLGFHNEGLLREYENWGDKGHTDLFMLAVLRKDWDITWG